MLEQESVSFVSDALSDAPLDGRLESGEHEAAGHEVGGVEEHVERVQKRTAPEPEHFAQPASRKGLHFGRLNGDRYHCTTDAVTIYRSTLPGQTNSTIFYAEYIVCSNYAINRFITSRAIFVINCSLRTRSTSVLADSIPSGEVVLTNRVITFFFERA